jgi:hypothetical protein
MSQWLSKLWPARRKTLAVESYWCGTPLKSASQVKTPLGSSVTLLDVCLDIVYSVRAGEITIHGASLAKTGTALPGCPPANMAANRTGEAFYAQNFEPESVLIELVENELGEPTNSLRRIMFGKWRDAYGDAELPPLKYGRANRN